MNAISSSHIYCFYPFFTAEGIAFKAYQGDPADIHAYCSTELLASRQERVANQNLQLFSEGINFYQQCSPFYCPEIERSVAGYRGVGILQWGGFQNSKRSEEETLSENHCQLVWRLGDWCHNRHCIISHRRSDV